MNWQEWSIIANDEDYWKNHEEEGLLKAEYIEGHVLQLWFEDNLSVSIYELDFAPLILETDPGVAFLPLREKERFQQVIGDYALIWPDPETTGYSEKTIDLAPECVRFFCEKYGKLINIPQKAIA